MESEILSYIAIDLSIVTTIVTTINHKRIRSNCCKKEISMSLDIENTSPPKILIPDQKALE